MSGDDSDLASKAERIKGRKTARTILEKMFAGEEGQAVIEQMLGLPLPFESLLKLVGTLMERNLRIAKGFNNWSKKRCKKFTLLFGALGYPRLSSAIANGYMESPWDVEGGEAAALRLRIPCCGLFQG